MFVVALCFRREDYGGDECIIRLFQSTLGADQYVADIKRKYQTEQVKDIRRSEYMKNTWAKSNPKPTDTIDAMEQKPKFDSDREKDKEYVREHTLKVHVWRDNVYKPAIQIQTEYEQKRRAVIEWYDKTFENEVVSQEELDQIEFDEDQYFTKIMEVFL